MAATTTTASTTPEEALRTANRARTAMREAYGDDEFIAAAQQLVDAYDVLAAFLMAGPLQHAGSKEPEEMAQVMASIAGQRLTTQLRQYLVRMNLVRLRDQSAMVEGVKAAVRLYYATNTDADELEGPFIASLTDIFGRVDVDQGLVFEAIRAAEGAINDAGGIEGSDGARHAVRTASAYLDEEP